MFRICFMSFGCLTVSGRNQIVSHAHMGTSQQPCAGDTRGDSMCNHDDTHRVCAKIGVSGTTFWKFTGQTNWCGTDIYGDGQTACPTEHPTWCICKWATADWIKAKVAMKTSSSIAVPPMFAT